MYCLTTIAALLGASALVTAAPTPCPAPSSSDTKTYQLKGFTTRTFDGKNIGTLSFNILATNGGTLDFACSPYDPAVGHATDSFEAGKVYFCAENSAFAFSYTPAEGTQKNELFLWQNISEGNAYGGKALLDTPGVCHAGGSTVNDEICATPDDIYVVITLDNLSA